MEIFCLKTPLIIGRRAVIGGNQYPRNPAERAIKTTESSELKRQSFAPDFPRWRMSCGEVFLTFEKPNSVRILIVRDGKHEIKKFVIVCFLQSSFQNRNVSSILFALIVGPLVVQTLCIHCVLTRSKR